MCGRGVSRQETDVGIWNHLENVPKAYNKNYSNVLGGSIYKCRFERDIISICIYGEIEIKRSQHRHDGAPDRGIRNVTA